MEFGFGLIAGIVLGALGGVSVMSLCMISKEAIRNRDEKNEK